MKKVCSRENFLHELDIPGGTEIITPTRGGAHRFKSIAAFFRKAYLLVAALYYLSRVKRFSRTVFCHTKTQIITLAHNGRLYSQSQTVAIQ